MKCQKCGINNANVVIKQNINGEKQTICLCSSCMDSSEMMNFENEFDNIFNHMFDNFNIFDENVSNILMPRVSVLIGDANKDKSFTKRHDLESVDFNKESGKIKQDNETLNNLELKLKESVLNEKYEDAAIIRDKIKSLKKKSA